MISQLKIMKEELNFTGEKLTKEAGKMIGINILENSQG